MTDPVLLAGQGGQYSIGSSGSSAAYVFGAGANGVYIQNTAIDTGSLTVQDQAVVGHDGMLFGVDTQPGMVITQTGWVRMATPALTMDQYSNLAGIWNDPAVRLVTGAIVVLRAAYPGSSVVRRCYGRGRKIQPTLGQVGQQVIPFTSQFQAADNTWYSDTQNSLTLTSVPSFSGGLKPPVTPPYQLAATTNFQSNTAVNTGSLPTWPVLTFTGPVSFPGVSYVNTPVVMNYNGILKVSDTLVIDTRPWARTALLNGSSVAGLLTGDPMIGLQLQPGSTVVRFKGQDFTGTSTVLMTWRNAYELIGGSQS